MIRSETVEEGLESANGTMVLFEMPRTDVALDGDTEEGAEGSEWQCTGRGPAVADDRILSSHDA
jgi:hypothetical protein